MPRYSDALGRFVRGQELVLHPSGPETATLSGPWFNTEEVSTLDLLLDVTAASGTTPSMTVSIETREGAADTPATVGSFAAKTGVASERKRFTALGKECRYVATISGTAPSFTFALTGVAK
jgi:hypothetical protein